MPVFNRLLEDTKRRDERKGKLAEEQRQIELKLNESLNPYYFGQTSSPREKKDFSETRSQKFLEGQSEHERVKSRR